MGQPTPEAGQARFMLTPVAPMAVEAAEAPPQPERRDGRLIATRQPGVALPVAVLLLAGLLAAMQAAILLLGSDAPRVLPVLAGAIALIVLGSLPVTSWWIVGRLRNAGAAEEQALRDLLGAGTEACLWWWEPTKDQAWFSERWQERLGFTPTPHRALLSWSSRVHAADRDTFLAEFDRLLDGWTDTIELGCRIVVKPDRHRWVRVQAVVSRTPDGRAARVAGSVIDVTEQHRAQFELAHGAFHDPLTGLPNRALFRDRLGHAFARAQRDPGYKFAVLHLDIDRFARINDVLGHRQGDRLLVEIARRLEPCVSPGDTIARYGGDEFTVLLDPVLSTYHADEVASRLQAAVSKPITAGGRELVLSSTIGTALSGPKYTVADELIRNAGAAKTAAKREGGASHALFNSAMHRRMEAAMHLEAELRSAFDNGQLEVHYQPIVDADSAHLRGFEALLRWQHETLGWVSPAEFVPLAEQIGLIERIGLFVAQEVCETVSAWPSPELTVSVNLSPLQLGSRTLVTDLARVFSDTGVDPSRLNFELTETAVMKDEVKSLAVLTELKALGVHLCIDDFGTGHSSLLYLHQFPIDVLKIDRAFIQGMDPTKPGIVRTIVDLARSLGMSTVAEGVEEVEQRLALEGLGCDALQGFLFSRAVPSDEARRMLDVQPDWSALRLSVAGE